MILLCKPGISTELTRLLSSNAIDGAHLLVNHMASHNHSFGER